MPSPHREPIEIPAPLLSSPQHPPNFSSCPQTPPHFCSYPHNDPNCSKMPQISEFYPRFLCTPKISFLEIWSCPRMPKFPFFLPQNAPNFPFFCPKTPQISPFFPQNAPNSPFSPLKNSSAEDVGVRPPGSGDGAQQGGEFGVNRGGFGVRKALGSNLDQNWGCWGVFVGPRRAAIVGW